MNARVDNRESPFFISSEVLRSGGKSFPCFAKASTSRTMESESSISSSSCLEPREYAKTVDPEAIRGRAIDRRIIEEEVRSATMIVCADPKKTRSASAHTKAPVPATNRPIASFLFDLVFRGVKSAWIPFWAGGFRMHIRSSGFQ